MHKSQVGSKIFKHAIDLKIPIFIYTVNTIQEMKKMQANQVAGVFTNFPDRLKKITTDNKNKKILLF